MACIIDRRGPREIGGFHDVGELNDVFRLLFTNVFLQLENVYRRWRLRRLGIDPDSIPRIRKLRRRRQTKRKLKHRTRQKHD